MSDDAARLGVLQRLALFDSPTEQAFDRLTRLAARFLRAPVALVSIVDENRQFFKSCVGLPEPWASRRETPLSHSFCKHLVAAGEPLVIEDARQHPLVCDNRAIPDLGVVAYLGMPLRTLAGVVLGSFCVIDHVPRSWTADDIEILRDLSGSVMTEIDLRGEIMERRRLEAIHADQARLATFSAEVAAALTGNDALPDILHASAASMVRHLHAAFARIWTLNPESTVLELQASAGMYTHLDGTHSRVPVGQFKIGLIAQERQPHLSNDVLHDPRVSDREWAKREGMRAFAGYPLLVGSQVIGVMALFARQPLSEFTLKALESVAGGLALGIVRKRSEEALRQAHEHLERKVNERTTALRRANSELQTEIGERKQAEEGLRKEKEFSDTVIDSLPGIFYLFDEGGRFLRWNRNFEQVTGYAAAEISCIHPLDLFVGDDRQVIEKRIEQALTQGEATAEANLVAKSGSRMPYFFTGKRVLLGATSCLVGMGIDISERRRAEEQIREQAELLNKATDAILVRDLEDRIRFWSRGAERLYGWTPAEAIGKSASELVFKGPSPALEEALRLVLEKGEWMGELRQVTKDGREIIVESRWTLLRNAQGIPHAKLTINTDVTGKKQLEAQYLRAQRMEGIGTLAGGIAHDLNNVLTPISMAVDLLKTSLHDKAGLSLLEILRASAARGADMVKQILSFARGAEGTHGVLQPKHILKDIDKMLQHTFPKSVEVKVSVPSNLWTIAGDPTQLHQVLLNLCVNARDAMPQGGRLTIAAENVVLDEQYARMHPQAKAGRCVLTTVADTGTGIPAAILDKIFDPFFTTKEQGKGTGLGLATVLGIVKGHGGHIDVQSEMGKGTKFSIYLPALEAGATSTEEEAQSALPAGAGELILIVDDEAGVREITKVTLEAHGYRVLAASDGAEAVAVYAQHRGAIQAVVMDMMMPVMDGPATIRALQRLDKAVRIIAISGLAETSKAVEVVSGGVQAFLTKPFTAATLLKMLREVLHGS